jgi:pimeloyl-ACP methyl ester carboxylesterase
VTRLGGLCFLWAKFSSTRSNSHLEAVSKLAADRYPPEKPKFKSPLVLVHGLWTGSWCWRTWATHFCNLGWECWALNLPGRGQDSDARTLRELNLQSCVDQLAPLIRSFSFPPLLIAHDTGALVALKAAEQTEITALVLVSPVPPRHVNIRRSRALRLMRLKYAPLIYLGRPFRIDDKDLQRIILSPLSDSVRTQLSKQFVSESSQMIAELFGSRVDIDPTRFHAPSLILSGGQDPLTPPASAREFARWLGAEVQEYDHQGHWLIEHNGETIVRDIHRWIIRKLGEKILLADFSSSNN